MIRTFPDFSEITLELKDEITSFTRRFDLYADFSFVNLFCWNTDGMAGVSILNKNLIVRLPDYVYGGEHIYSILGDQDLDMSVHTVLQTVNRLDLVPETVISHLKHPEKYAIAEDRDSFDYLYYVDDLCKLSGSKLKNKRQKVSQTTKQLGRRISFQTVDSINEELCDEMMDVLKRWQIQTPQPAQHTRLEEIALKRLFENFDHFSLQITMLRLDGKLEGFSINEIISKDIGICHFEKSITKQHDGTYAILINQAAKALQGKTKVVNWEQDLGIPGLKHIKRSYAPFSFYRKYWINNGAGETKK